MVFKMGPLDTKGYQIVLCFATKGRSCDTRLKGQIVHVQSTRERSLGYIHIRGNFLLYSKN